MTDPTPLSPAAQAIVDAYWDSPWDPSLQHDRKAIAAALRAAASHLTSYKAMNQLCAIAAELEGAQ
jgi:hypothetical protein